MIYIYIFENDVKFSPLAPFNGDLKAVEDGDLQVLRVKWLEEVVEAATGAGEWEEIPKAQYWSTLGIEGHE